MEPSKDIVCIKKSRIYFSAALIIFLFLIPCFLFYTYYLNQSLAIETAEALRQQSEQTLKNRETDWAGIGRYAQRNAELAQLPNDSGRVVFFGDSITYLWQLEKYFPAQPFINRGIGGQTTAQMLLRFHSDVVDLKPKTVLILAGTNDIFWNTKLGYIENTKANLSALTELARANKINVILASLLPVNDYEKDQAGNSIIQTDTRPPSKILELNDWIKKYAIENKLIYLDYFSAMTDDKGFLKPELSDDGLHPNEKGYQVMKPLAEQAIRTSLQNPPSKSSK